MNVTISLHYITAPGEKLYVVSPQVDNRQLELHDCGDGNKSVTFAIPETTEAIKYHFEAIDALGNIRKEWHGDRHITVTLDVTDLNIIDNWRDRPDDAPLYSCAFTQSIAARHKSTPLPSIAPGTLTLEVMATMIPSGRHVAICGNCRLLGDWNPDKALRLNDADYPVWKTSLPIDSLPENLEWKFIIADSVTGQLLSWEPGDNHYLHIDRQHSTICLPSLYLRSSEPLWRGAGVAVPVFSLRTNDDYGCGDFHSLLQIIDWAAETGQNFVQILPINDTNMTGTKADSYPYNAISSFALHPMYLHPDSIGQIADAKLRERFETERHRLNSLPTVDYEGVMRLKSEITRQLFAQQGLDDLKSDSFQRFFNENASWLEPYAAYCILRDLHGSAELSKWGEFTKYTPTSIARLLARHSSERDYIYFLQYHLDRQLRQASTYAHKRGVNLKGDLPIGIARNSVEAWLAPELYNLDSSAGAPPDDFSTTGQNWGFPTYNWEQMATDNYQWWKTRFRKMADYFDAYRIDHLLGFFRIWQMPVTSVRGLTGTFYPALPLEPNEITERFGFDFDPELHTSPLLTTSILQSALKDFPEAINQFFELKKGADSDSWQFKPEYASQRLIASHLKDTDTKLRDILFTLNENLLFIPDPKNPQKYHPRIAAHNTTAYASLSHEQQQAFNRLHEDFFYHRHNDFWRDSALMKLPPLIDTTSMLACAEDLGMIPHCVPEVMADLRLLSLEVQRMPKQFGKAFDNPAEYPWLSVSTTSTHDMAPLRLWWRQSQSLINKYYHDMLGMEGEVPQDADAQICYRVISDMMRSPSMLSIIPVQDWLSISETLRNPTPETEQINNPADPHNYWCYRMHIDIAQIRADENFNNKVRSLTALRKI